MTIPRIDILGVPVDCLTSREAIGAVGRMLHTSRPDSVIAVNPEKVMQARRNPRLLEQLMQTSLLIPDGIGVVWAARRKSGRRVQRVAGADLMPEVCEMARQQGSRIFLFGGKPGISDRVALSLQSRHSGINIVGTQHGYVAEPDMDALIARINDLKTDILFLALGSPKQECWMARYLPRLNIKLCQGVGGTFDVLAGHVRRAPKVFQICHTEWLYRLLTNPTRLSRQQNLVPYVFLTLKHHVLGVRH